MSWKNKKINKKGDFMSKKKIALVVDADDWAYANIAKNVSKNIGEFYDFKIFPSQYFNDELAKVLIMTEEFDLIHFFWRGKLLGFDYYEFDSYVTSLGYTKEEFKKKFFDKKIITTAVYDHLYLDEDKMDFTKKIVATCDKYYVSSNRLKNIYDKLELEKYPECVITDGVDLNRFYPINLERFKNIKNRKLVVGWVGNSAWESGTEDFKGVNTILKPVINELIEEGYNIEPYFADRQERMIPHDEMINYYSKIDLYVCTSKIEGTPNPVLESMACGIPIISTDVGIVPDALGDMQKEFILKERTKECLKERLIYLLNNLDIIEELSKENLESINDWTWKEISYRMKKFFDSAFQEVKK